MHLSAVLCAWILLLHISGMSPPWRQILQYNYDCLYVHIINRAVCKCSNFILCTHVRNYAHIKGHLEPTHLKSSPLFTLSTKPLGQDSPSVHLFSITIGSRWRRIFDDPWGGWVPRYPLTAALNLVKKHYGWMEWTVLSNTSAAVHLVSYHLITRQAAYRVLCH